MVKKSRLIELLQALEGDPLVMVASDAEWNEVRPFDGLETGLKFDTNYDQVFNPNEEEYKDDLNILIDQNTYPDIVVIYPEG